MGLYQSHLPIISKNMPIVISILIRLQVVSVLFIGSLVAAQAEPTIADFKREYASYKKLSDSKQWAASLEHAKNSYDLGKILFGQSSKNTSALAYNYGLNLMAVQKDSEAEKILEEALEIYEGVYGEHSVDLIPVLMDLGHSMAQPYQMERQLVHYRRALKIAKNHYGDESIEYAQRSVEAGISMLLRAQSLRAKKYLYAGHKILEKRLGQNDFRAGYAAFNIGKYELSTSNYDQAAHYFNKALVSFSVADQPSNKFELTTHGFLVETYENLGQRDMATKHCLAIGRMTPVTDVQNYQPLFKAAPTYPMSALKRQQEGHVTLEYEVDDFGFVKNPRVIEIDGPKAFADVAIEAAEKFRYAPSFKDGKPVITEGVRNTFTFEISY